MHRMAVGFVALLLVGSGCCSGRAPRPSMTVEDAMRQVAGGLNAFSAMDLDKRSGLLPAEITVVLNVTEDRTMGGGAQAGAAAGAGKLMVDFSAQEKETRGNQIVFKFQHVLLAEKNSILGSKAPDDIAALLHALTNQNFLLKSVPPPGK